MREQTSSFFIGGDAYAIDNEGELMDEFIVRALSAISSEPAELVDHSTGDALSHPYVAVDDPDDVAFCLAVTAAHVADLGVGAKVRGLSATTAEVGVFFLNEDMHVEDGEVGEEAGKDGIGRIGARGDAEVDGELGRGVCLVEGGG